MNNGILIPDKKLIYVFIPKCACTSLKAFFADHLGLEYTNPHIAPFRKIRVNELPQYHAQGWDSFTLVRHPLDRLVSLYRDKIRPGFRGKGFPDGVERIVFGGFDGFHENMTFSEFAFKCMNIPPSFADSHFLPQWPLIAPYHIELPKYRFHMENMESLFSFLSDKGFDTSKIPHRNKTKRVVSWLQRYDDTLIHRARSYYIDDLQNLNYD